MAERLEDLNLPVTAITRIAKEVLPANIIVSKEAKTALARAASVFILYVSNQATTIAASRNKKTISAQDVLEALAQVDFECMIEPLQQLLEGILIHDIKRLTYRDQLVLVRLHGISFVVLSLALD